MMLIMNLNVYYVTQLAKLAEEQNPVSALLVWQGGQSLTLLQEPALLALLINTTMEAIARIALLSVKPVIMRLLAQNVKRTLVSALGVVFVTQRMRFGKTPPVQFLLVRNVPRVARHARVTQFVLVVARIMNLKTRFALAPF